MKSIFLKGVLIFICFFLTGCAAIKSKSSNQSQSSYQPEYGYVTSAYAYPGYNYYPTRPSIFDTHDVAKSKNK